MTGRIEHENKLQNKIDEKLSTLPPVFRAYYSYLEADQKSYGSIKHYIEYVSDFMYYATEGNPSNDFYQDITVATIREYIISLRRRNKNGQQVQNSDSIQATRWSALNSFFNFLALDDYIQVNPMMKTKRPKNRTQKPIVYLEDTEINNILDKIRKESKPTLVNRDIAIITLGIATGIRVGALVQINIEDIDFKNNTIHLIEKGGKERYIPFGSNTRAALSLWIIDRETYFSALDTDALFISQWNRRLTVDGVRKLFKKYADGINGKHITPHTLRKSAATNLVKANVDIQTIADMLGHNSIETTRRYAAILEENKKKATEALDNLF